MINIRYFHKTQRPFSIRVWFIDINVNLYVDRIISYVNKRRSTRQDEKAQETQTRIESKEQLQDILKSMENLLNHGPGSSLSCLFSIFFIGATINSRFNDEKYGYGEENIYSNCSRIKSYKKSRIK